MPRLRIAQVGPLWENIPPTTYGGTERIVSYLTEGLVKLGHDVTLFAAGTSRTNAKLISVYPRPLFRDSIDWTSTMYPLINIITVLDQADQFDIIHIHLSKSNDYPAIPLSNSFARKVVFTPHFPYPAAEGRIDRHLILQRYKHMNYISISNAQRRSGENLNWLKTVYNGIDLSPYHFHPEPKDYFLWLGNFSPNKGTYEAILAAKKAGVKLYLAGKLNGLSEDDSRYYHDKIEPHIDSRQITYIGELTDQDKNKYMGEAVGFLNPIQWNEPFGLVMAEAMACGTPVISFGNGAAPEVVSDKETGFLVNDVAAMAQRIQDIHTIKRQACRKRVERLFSAEKMTEGYIEAYAEILQSV